MKTAQFWQATFSLAHARPEPIRPKQVSSSLSLASSHARDDEQSRRRRRLGPGPDGCGRRCRGAEAEAAAAEGRCRRLQPHRQLLLPHQHRPRTSPAPCFPFTSGSPEALWLTLVRDGMVRSTTHPCETRRRPSRWRCAQPAWYGPASLPTNH